MKRSVNESNGIGIIVFLVFFGIIWCSIAFSMAALLFTSDIAILGIIPLLMVGFGITIVVLSINRMIRYNAVMRKKISGRGKITKIGKVYYQGHSHSSTFSLEFDYKDEFGEDAHSVTSLDAAYYSLFFEGDEIPIFIGGKYAYPNIEQIRKELKDARDNNRSYKNYEEVYKEVEQKYKVCTFCGGKVKEDESRCPYCNGNQFEDIK